MNIKDIKKGDEFYEYAYGFTVKARANEDARIVKNQPNRADGWEVEATVIGGQGLVGEKTYFYSSNIGSAYASDLQLIKKGAEQ